MDAHILLSPVGQKTETRFNCLLTENRKSTEMVGTPSTVCGLLPPLRRGTRSARPRGLGGDFEFLPLKSPRNPITPIETSRVATLHPGLYKGLRKDVRRVIGAIAKPLYAIGGKTGGFDRRVNPVRWREETFSTECGRGTPSTACGRSPSLEEGGLWGEVRGTSKYR